MAHKCVHLARSCRHGLRVHRQVGLLVDELGFGEQRQWQRTEALVGQSECFGGVALAAEVGGDAGGGLVRGAERAEQLGEAAEDAAAVGRGEDEGSE